MGNKQYTIKVNFNLDLYVGQAGVSAENAIDNLFSGAQLDALKASVIEFVEFAEMGDFKVLEVEEGK